MSTSAVIGYEASTAAPVVLTDADIGGWMFVESSGETLPRAVARWCPSQWTLIVDLGGGLATSAKGYVSVRAEEVAQYAFACSGEAGRYSERLARGLAAALNLNEEEHIALQNATRSYYSNAEAGGVISISSMLPEKARQLELLKSKLDELTVIPPTFGSEEKKIERAIARLDGVPGRYARRALAFAVIAKFAMEHPRGTVVVGAFDEMLPEGTTKSMRYPLEMAASLLWTLKGESFRLVAQGRRPLPKEMDGIFQTKIIETEGAARMKRAGHDWEELYLVNELSGAYAGDESGAATEEGEDEEATKIVLDTVARYANVSYAGLVSFLKGQMEEARIQRAVDRLIREGHVELRRGQGDVHYLSLTERGRTLRSSLEGRVE